MKYLKYCYLLFGLFFFWTCQSESSTSQEASTTSSPHKVTGNSNAKAFAGMPVLPKTQKAQSGKLYPVDEGQLSPDFQRFRKELLEAIARKDARFIEQMITEDIKVSFGGDLGKAAFAEKWKLDAPDSPFWQTCRKILQLGGTFDRHNENGFMVPYLAGTWPDLEQPSAYAVVTGKEVKLRKTPSWDGAIVGTLDYDIVRLGPKTGESQFSILEGEKWPWVKIEMPDKSGMAYVYGKYIHSPVDYWAYFERVKGQWKMPYFLAGA